MKHEISIWGHVILPICIAVIVFLLLIVLVVLWNRCKRQQYKRSKMDDPCEKDVHNIVFPDDQCPSPDGTDEGAGEWAAGYKAGASLVPRDPLVIDHGHRADERAGAAVLSKMCTVETVDEGLGDDDTDIERRSRSSSVCSDCPPESLESPKIPSTASQHSLLQMEV